jgi:hypothetical protein
LWIECLLGFVFFMAAFAMQRLTHACLILDSSKDQ